MRGGLVGVQVEAQLDADAARRLHVLQRDRGGPELGKLLLGQLEQACLQLVLASPERIDDLFVTDASGRCCRRRACVVLWRAPHGTDPEDLVCVPRHAHGIASACPRLRECPQVISRKVDLGPDRGVI